MPITTRIIATCDRCNTEIDNGTGYIYIPEYCLVYHRGCFARATAIEFAAHMGIDDIADVSGEGVETRVRDPHTLVKYSGETAP